jgi:hypothetical protein
MKNFPGIVKVSGLIAMAIVVILIAQACCPFNFGIKNGILFGLLIKYPQQIVSEAKFAAAVGNLSAAAIYDIHLVRDDGTFRDFRRGSKMSIKTDRVITTELAKSVSNDEFTPIGSSISHHLYSPDPKDIAIVLNQIEK